MSITLEGGNMKCECGYDNPDGSKFCGKCGEDLRQKRKAKEVSVL